MQPARGDGHRPGENPQSVGVAQGRSDVVRLICVSRRKVSSSTSSQRPRDLLAIVDDCDDHITSLHAPVTEAA